MNINTQKPYKGIVTDISPLEQPKESYRYALNVINTSDEGDMLVLSNELSNEDTTIFSNGFKILESVYMNDDNVIIFGKAGSFDYIGILNKHQEFDAVVKTTVLNFSEDHPIKAIFRLRRNQQRVVYFTDSLNKPRIFNFDRLYDFYSRDYKLYLDNPVGEFTGEKWEAIHFELIKSYSKIPEFTNVEVLNERGSIKSGSYSLAIQLVDENLNPTEWITVSHPVRIYNDSLNTKYHQIRGSRNSSTDAQNFKSSSKSIKWTLGNLDTDFSFYRVAVLQANYGDGNINQALVSQLIPIDNGTYTYTGNDNDMVVTNISDIQTNSIDIASAKYITQMENRMVLANIKGKQINWCEFQSKASLIKSQLVTQDVEVNNVNSIGNAKNPVSSFYLTGYMPDEVYSFGIVYTLKDGSKSPVFHIPGRIKGTEQNPDPYNTGMDYYECTEVKYPDIHKCMSFDYWGIDGYSGLSLVDTPIRHHKFPPRTKPIIEQKTTTILDGYTNLIQFSVDFWVSNEDHLTVKYKVSNTEYIKTVIMPADYQAGTPLFVANKRGSNAHITSVTFKGSGAIEDPPPILEWTDKTVTNSPNYITVNSKVSETFGIKFTNIVIPHPDVIGFEIVRNERLEDDKLVVDNVLIGPMINDDEGTSPNPNPYHAFGLLMPDIATSKISKTSFYIFSPEHQFLFKHLIFDKIKVTGEYKRNSNFIGKTIYDDDDGNYHLACNGFMVNDVQAGTTFNPEYNTGEDPDGFDLHVLYRSTNTVYNSLLSSNINVPVPEELLYLSASGHKQLDNGTYYNASIDNKIVVAKFSDSEDVSSLFKDNSHDRLLTATLIRESTDCYSNFMARPYYKEHNNVIMFDKNGEESDNIFNGDSYINPMTINSSTYYDTKFADREKKSRVWKIVVGAVLVAAAIVVNVIPIGGQLISAGLTAVAAQMLTAATIMAISYGISMVVSGIEFETLKQMIDKDYEAGLKYCVRDNVNRDLLYSEGEYAEEDDKFCWFVDNIYDIYFESSVNIGLRSGTTAAISDYYNNFEEPLKDYTTNAISSSADNLEAYLTTKLTTIDRERNSGRLYLGYATAEFYDINIDYLRKNKEKTYYTIPYEYECCSKEKETFTNRVVYSEQAFQEEKIDNYRKFLPNNYKDIEGEYGAITNIFKIGSNLMIHTEEALFQMPQNLQEKVTNELTTFIGTGDFFALSPQKLESANGSVDNSATIETPIGVFYVSERNKTINLIGQGVKELSNGNSIWFYNNLGSELSKYCYDKFGVPYIHYGNLIKGLGIHAVYDAKFKRILLTKIDYKPLVEFLPFVQGDMSLVDKYAYNTITGEFGIVSLEDTAKLVLNHIPFTDETVFENKSWTMSYSLLTDSWISYHSYIPRVFIGTPNLLYSYDNILTNQDYKLYKHHKKGNFLSFYNRKSPYIIELVSVSNPLVERLWHDISLMLTSKKYMPQFDAYVDVKDKFFNKIIVYNNYQCSGEKNIFIKSDILKTKAGANYMLAQVNNSSSEIVANRVEGTWNMNNFRNYVDDYEQPMFLTSWHNIKADYPIDKVLNPTVININKNWMELERFRSKYLIIRLIFSNFASENDNVQLSLNYSLETEQPSIR